MEDEKRQAYITTLGFVIAILIMMIAIIHAYTITINQTKTASIEKVEISEIEQIHVCGYKVVIYNGSRFVIEYEGVKHEGLPAYTQVHITLAEGQIEKIECEIR